MFQSQIHQLSRPFKKKKNLSPKFKDKIDTLLIFNSPHVVHTVQVHPSLHIANTSILPFYDSAKV